MIGSSITKKYIYIEDKKKKKLYIPNNHCVYLEDVGACRNPCERAKN